MPYFASPYGASKFVGFVFGIGTLLFGLVLTMPTSSGGAGGGAERTQLDTQRGASSGLSEVTLNKHNNNSSNGTEMAAEGVIVVETGRGSGYSEPTQAL